MIHETTAALITVAGIFTGFIVGGGIAFNKMNKKSQTQTVFRNTRVMQPKKQADIHTMQHIIAAQLKKNGEVQVGVEKNRMEKFVRTIADILKVEVSTIDIRPVDGWKDRYFLYLKKTINGNSKVSNPN